MSSLYVFTGPDRARKRERLAILAQELGVDLLDQQTVPAAGWSAAMLVGAIRQQPIASPMRLVVIEDAEALAAAGVSVLAEADWDAQPACVVLCTDETWQGASALASLASTANVESFEWLPLAEAQRWLSGHVARVRKRIAPDAARALAQTLGSDTLGLRAAADQLIAWVGARPQITLADVRTFFTPAAPTTNTFALVNAIAQRDVAAALQAYQEQLANGKDALEALGLLIWQVQRWLLVSQLLQAGDAEPRIEQVTGIKPWQLSRLRSELAGRSLDELRHMLRRCWEVDAAAKRGQIPVVELAVELLVVELAKSGASRRTSSPGLSPVAA